MSKKVASKKWPSSPSADGTREVVVDKKPWNRNSFGLGICLGAAIVGITCLTLDFVEQQAARAFPPQENAATEFSAQLKIDKQKKVLENCDWFEGVIKKKAGTFADSNLFSVGPGIIDDVVDCLNERGYDASTTWGTGSDGGKLFIVDLEELYE